MLVVGLRNIKVALVIGAAIVSSSSAARAHPGVHHDIERITRVLEQEPKRADLLIERGVFFRMEGNFAASLADFDKAEALDAKNIDISAHRGMTLSAMRRDQDAERELSRFLSNGRASAPAFAERGLVRARLGRVDQAIDDYSKSLAISPDVEIFVERSKLQEAAGKLNDAASGLREGVASTGGAVVLRDRLISIELARKNYDAAIRIVDDQIAVTQVRTEWFLRRAMLLEAAGRNNEAHKSRLDAVDEATRALAKRPSAIHMLARARANLALGRIIESKRDAESALEIAPGLTEAQVLLSELGKRNDPEMGLANTQKRSR